MSLKERARALKQEAHAIYFAVRDPRTPMVARVIGGAAVAYALSPIDLIPDFIPVLGYLDDVLIVPVGLWLALRMIPAEVMQDARERARDAATPVGLV